MDVRRGEKNEIRFSTLVFEYVRALEMLKRQEVTARPQLLVGRALKRLFLKTGAKLWAQSSGRGADVKNLFLGGKVLPRILSGLSNFFGFFLSERAVPHELV